MDQLELIIELKCAVTKLTEQVSNLALEIKELKEAKKQVKTGITFPLIVAMLSTIITACITKLV